MKLVKKNWIDFVKHHTFLFSLLIIAQIVSVICILFVYGVFQNNMYELLEGNLDCYDLSATSEDGIEPTIFEEKIKEMVDDKNFDLDMVYFSGTDKENHTLHDRFEYKQGKFDYSSTTKKTGTMIKDGDYPTSEDYENKAKVVLINENEKEQIGDEINICGEDYTVIGIENNDEKGSYEIPFTAFPTESKVHSIYFTFKTLPTRSEYDSFNELMVSLGAQPDEFYIKNEEDTRRQYSLLIISVLLAILSGGNLYIIYCYIFRQRQEQLAVFSLCGCSRVKARNMFMSEIIFNLIVCMSIGFVLFVYCIYPWMTNWYTYLDRIYSGKEYACLLGIYAVVTLIFGLIISRKMSKLSVNDLMRGCTE